MTYRDVTLAPDDIEWDDGRDRFDRLQPLTFWHADDAFTHYVEQTGVVVALEEFTEFHRHIANQLIARAVKRMDAGDWASRTIRLCKALKRRRNMLRAWTVELLGVDEAEALFDVLDSRWPRAVWGSSPYARNEN